MKVLRHFFLALLVLVMLPWGAFVHAAQSAPPQPVAASADQPPLTRAAPLPPNCRTAALAGGVCHLDFSLDDDQDLDLPSQKDADLSPSEQLTPAEWTGPVLIPPPRLN